MKLSAEFKNDSCVLHITPEDDWEMKLLGAVAKGGSKLEAIVTYSPEYPISYGSCKAMKVLLRALGTEDVK